MSENSFLLKPFNGISYVQYVGESIMRICHSQLHGRDNTRRSWREAGKQTQRQYFQSFKLKRISRFTQTSYDILKQWRWFLATSSCHASENSLWIQTAVVTNTSIDGLPQKIFISIATSP